MCIRDSHTPWRTAPSSRHADRRAAATCVTFQSRICRCSLCRSQSRTWHRSADRTSSLDDGFCQRHRPSNDAFQTRCKGGGSAFHRGKGITGSPVGNQSATRHSTGLSGYAYRRHVGLTARLVATAQMITDCSNVRLPIPSSKIPRSSTHSRDCSKISLEYASNTIRSPGPNNLGSIWSRNRSGNSSR